ncbi:MAG: potassium/proton antiporter [Fimbriimonas sp.]
MHGIDARHIEPAMVVVAVLLVLSVVASRLSSRLGVPTLLLFIGIGMLAGSDGPGGLYFDDALATKNLGAVGLAFILFAGGLETTWRSIRPVFAPAVTLATLGVVLTAGLVALFANRLLGFGPVEALLLGSIVSSTDAAAVFAVLRARGIRLIHRLGPLLELESGSNDPMAIFLTTALTAIALNPGRSAVGFLPAFGLEMLLGAAAGYAIGTATAWTVNRVRLDYDGLYSALTIGCVLLAYGGTHMVGGNGFLGVYVAGVSMGSRAFVRKQSLTQFHDGVAWLMQIALFLTLGLLAFPKRIAPLALSGLVLALFLVFVARPLAVYLSLAPFRVPVRERLFVGWVGLRGAVPIVLATIPLTANLPRAHEIFDLVFFVVLLSVLLQGTTIRPVAEWLGVVAAAEPEPEPLERRGPKNTVEVILGPGSPAVGKRVVDLDLPVSSLLILVTRGTETFVPRGSTRFEADDVILIATRKRDLDEIREALGGAVQEGKGDSRYST